MLNTNLALKASRGLALVVAVAVTQIGCGGPPPPETPPPPTDAPVAAETGDADDVVVADFSEPLGNYGVWIDEPTYGRVWQPADDVAGDEFTPYASDGSWSANEDGSWVYESKYDTEYGWATYHYGRWVEHDDYGWVWLPGTEWAPSWVDWRYGGGNVGWVALGPPGVEVVESRWTFVDQVHFADPGWRTYRMAPERVHEAFVGSSGIAVGAGVHFSLGPPVASIRAAGGAVRAAHVGRPAKGAVKAHAQASVERAKSTNRPKPAATPVKRGPAARAGKAQPGATPAKGGRPEPKPAAGKPEPKPAAGKPAAGRPEPKAEPKPAATTAKPKPKPEEEEKKKPASKPAPKPKKK